MRNFLLVLILVFSTCFLQGQAAIGAHTYKSKSNKTKDSTKEERMLVRAENRQFEDLKGRMLFPVDSIIDFELYEKSPISNGEDFYFCPGVMTFTCRKNAIVKSITSCTVAVVTNVGSTGAVVLETGNYCITYVNLKNINVKKYSRLNAGDVIGELDDTYDDKSELEVSLSTRDNKYLLPSKWFKLPSIPTTKIENKKL